jgi:hypothetical protein
MKLKYIAAIAALAAVITPATHAADWVYIANPSMAGFTDGPKQVTYGPVAASSVWVYDGANLANQNPDTIENLVEHQFNLPDTGPGSLSLISYGNVGNTFTLNAGTSYAAIHYGKGELLFHWDTPLQSDIAFTIGNLPHGISDFRAYGLITTPVPEPTTYAMLASGLGLIGFMARRRKDKRQA